MLVLSRKVGERIIIADSIVLTVLESYGNRVRLGITAPASVDIKREELLSSNRSAEPNLPPIMLLTE